MAFPDEDETGSFHLPAAMSMNSGFTTCLQKSRIFTHSITFHKLQEAFQPILQ